MNSELVYNEERLDRDLDSQVLNGNELLSGKHDAINPAEDGFPVPIEGIIEDYNQKPYFLGYYSDEWQKRVKKTLYIAKYLPTDKFNEQIDDLKFCFDLQFEAVYDHIKKRDMHSQLSDLYISFGEGDHCYCFKCFPYRDQLIYPKNVFFVGKIMMNFDIEDKKCRYLLIEKMVGEDCLVGKVISELFNLENEELKNHLKEQSIINLAWNIAAHCHGVGFNDNRMYHKTNTHSIITTGESLQKLSKKLAKGKETFLKIPNITDKFKELLEDLFLDLSSLLPSDPKSNPENKNIGIWSAGRLLEGFCKAEEVKVISKEHKAALLLAVCAIARAYYFLGKITDDGGHAAQDGLDLSKTWQKYPFAAFLSTVILLTCLPVRICWSEKEIDGILPSNALKLNISTSKLELFRNGSLDKELFEKLKENNKCECKKEKNECKFDLGGKRIAYLSKVLGPEFLGLLQNNLETKDLCYDIETYRKRRVLYGARGEK